MAARRIRGRIRRADPLLILLPPSEGKAGPFRRGRPVDLDRLSLPELNPGRSKIIDALINISSGPQAAEILDLGPTAVGELELNRTLLEQPARPAAEIYTGVLYDALDLAGLESAARRRASAAIRVQSALWGPIKITDRIPPYRLSIGTNLPGIGPLPALWRQQLAGVLDDAHAQELIIDCRSTGYAAAWRPERTDKLIKVNAVTERAGNRSVVSHFAKHTRGAVARLLLQAPRSPRTVAQVAEIVAEHASCELTGPTRTGWELTVITDPTGRM
ncbi:peroxide stress protein YaaA [Microlunatus elymi]|uniref:Peroxide stress protein YaaA n=1 Tax=Microlunatus elymi TaxID=2596828 RepID=A0A516PU38_9ACTN|nr:peroxide stress protein YaaA [Microlunatus elymi]QDP94662.1 peroxide stress protein YaaA [Microlunatus elymi]